MPELPDIAIYLEALERRILGAELTGLRIASPFLVRSVDPPIRTAAGHRVESLRRLGKRIVIGLDGDLFLVLHLMIAGRLQWAAAGAPLPGRKGLAAFDFAGGPSGGGTLLLTEMGSKKRASLHLVRGAAALAEHDPGGVEPLEASRDGFAAALTAGNHTLKRALTDPRLFAGIGNAYSDEILHAAGLSPIAMTSRLDEAEIDRLYEATRATLLAWIERGRREVGDGWPTRVTAFRPAMAAHGRYGKPCPVCGTPIQRIVHADNETNYCPRCQTGGRLLADRALSGLLKKDWPKTIDELENRRKNP
ncbi:putative formamidopyrimidine-DNA glycosylase [Thalassobaculum fulvum]|uniref:Formamidopyrimidine-DNA glycosylase n=1 Tax=Thalassobaculum fulvum TaxID=1633335 RepID=A0A918XRJ7_9PROT|nr:DNA-formamidopyrimidine glycosylase family protein [Thalassobaculum fulvum]GHD48811.1 putative formamidopyrimidine-DNA glycosylase [Thalassobaculum fulvum]